MSCDEFLKRRFPYNMLGKVRVKAEIYGQQLLRGFSGRWIVGIQFVPWSLSPCNQYLWCNTCLILEPKK